MEVKVCQTCFETKPVAKFKLTKLGNTRAKCIDCTQQYHREYQRLYVVENRELINFKERLRRERKGMKTRKPVEKKVRTVCKVRNCGEPVSQLDYCKSHAFDKINKCNV